MNEHQRSARRRHRATAVLILPLMLPLGACGGGSNDAGPAVTVPAASAPSASSATPGASTATDYPSQALVLRDTIPLSYQHRILTAYSFTTTTSHLDVVGLDGNTSLVIVRKGRTFSAGGLGLKVIDLIPGNPAGGSTGQLVLLPLGPSG